MASCVVNVLVFLFSLTQVACNALRSWSTAPCLPALVVDPFAELLTEADGVGVVVSDAATAAVPAPPMMAALAPTTAIVFHMMGSLVHCSGEWSCVANLARLRCGPGQGIVRIVFGPLRVL